MWINTCRKCHKELNGLQWNYGKEWMCSDCTEDKESVLFCEKDCHVKAIHLDYGYNCDSEKANEYLEQDKIYTVKFVEVNRSDSNIELKEFPKVKFNTVHFKRVNIMPRIENWSIYKDDSNIFIAPELRPKMLQGNIYDDSRFNDGEFITTSELTKLDIDNDLAKTNHTEYILGEPDKKFKKIYYNYFE